MTSRRGRPPPAVHRAVGLIWGVFVLGVASAVLNVLQDPDGTRDDLVILLIGLGVSIVVPAALTPFIRRSHPWARLCFLAVGPLGVALRTAGLVGSLSTSSWLLSAFQLVSIVMTLAAIGLLLRPDSRAYYAG